jgi:hypothetical protein
MMRLLLAVGFLAVVLSGCTGRALQESGPSGLSPTPSAARAGWFDCRIDTDCQMIRDPICRLISVNRAHVDALVRWVAAEELTRPEQPTCDSTVPVREIDYYPKCDAGKCSSLPSVEPFPVEALPARRR